MRVSELINPARHEWLADKVRSVFHEEDVAVVESIPLSGFNMEDKWIWHYMNDGVYSVKSGYETTMTIKR